MVSGGCGWWGVTQTHLRVHHVDGELAAVGARVGAAVEEVEAEDAGEPVPGEAAAVALLDLHLSSGEESGSQNCAKNCVTKLRGELRRELRRELRARAWSFDGQYFSADS